MAETTIALIQRIQDLEGLYIRLHFADRGSRTAHQDGLCRGVQNGSSVILETAAGEQVAIPLELIRTVTQLPNPAGGMR